MDDDLQKARVLGLDLRGTDRIRNDYQFNNLCGRGADPTDVEGNAH